MPDRITRRDFLGSTAPAAIGVGVIGSHVFAQAAQRGLGANGDVRIGLIGCGGRGRYLLDRFGTHAGVRLVAICDVHRERMAEVRANTGGTAKMHEDYRDVLAHKDIDAVIVATTGHWHVLPAIDACKAGKDVYLEKPVGTSIGEGRAVIEAARKYNRIVHMGTQQRSWEHYQKAVEIIRSGELGEISEVRVCDLENFYPGFGNPPDGAPPPELNWDFYLGPSPEVPYNPNRYIRHYWFFDYGGGWQLDWAVHHYDIVHWAMQVSAPRAAIGMGGKFAYKNDNTQWPDTFAGACEYDPSPSASKGFLMTYTFRGACNHPIEKRYHGKVFYGSNGTMALDRSGFEIFSQARDGKKVIEERVGRSKHEHDAVNDHVGVFLDCIRNRKPSPADIQLGHEASNPGHLMNIAWRVGRRIEWNAETEHVINDPEADKWVTKQYREPWSLSV